MTTPAAGRKSLVIRYLQLISATKVMPAHIRSNMGTETLLLANGHLRLSQSNSPNIELALHDVYCYGPSTKNQELSLGGDSCVKNRC